MSNWFGAYELSCFLKSLQSFLDSCVLILLYQKLYQKALQYYALLKLNTDYSCCYVQCHFLYLLFFLPDLIDTIPAPSLSKESTEIEYHGHPEMDEDVKRVRVVSAPREVPKKRNETTKVKAKSGPVKITERPRWGYTNQDHKKSVRQTERDPFYQRRKKERDAARAQRQEELLAMAERDAPKIASHTTQASRSRSSERKNSVGAVEAKRDKSEGRDSQSERQANPAVPHLTNLNNPSPGGSTAHGHQSRSDVHRLKTDGKVHVVNPAGKDTSRSVDMTSAYRSPSPPVPAVKHKHHHDDPYTQRDSHRPPVGTHSKYQDAGPVNAPTQNGSFIPFVRSSNVLNPAHADSPVPMSREATAVERARQAYVQEHAPAKFGKTMENYRDKHLDAIRPPEKITVKVGFNNIVPVKAY